MDLPADWIRARGLYVIFLVSRNGKDADRTGAWEDTSKRAGDNNVPSKVTKDLSPTPPPFDPFSSDFPLVTRPLYRVVCSEELLFIPRHTLGPVDGSHKGNSNVAEAKATRIREATKAGLRGHPRVRDTFVYEYESGG